MKTTETAEMAREMLEELGRPWFTAWDFSVHYHREYEYTNDRLRVAARAGLLERVRLKDSPLDAGEHEGSRFAYRVVEHPA